MSFSDDSTASSIGVYLLRVAALLDCHFLYMIVYGPFTTKLQLCSLTPSAIMQFLVPERPKKGGKSKGDEFLNQKKKKPREDSAKSQPDAGLEPATVRFQNRSTKSRTLYRLS